MKVQHMSPKWYQMIFHFFPLLKMGIFLVLALLPLPQRGQYGGMSFMQEIFNFVVHKGPFWY
jgi:hypothetical protein